MQGEIIRDLLFIQIAQKLASGKGIITIKDLYTNACNFGKLVNKVLYRKVFGEHRAHPVKMC